VGTSSSLDLAAVSPTRRVGEGATIDVPMLVKVLNAGVPQSGVVVNYRLTNGTATLSASSATTNGEGYATASAHLANHNADVQVSACVAPNNAPCQTFTLYAIAASFWTLATISGSAQVVTDGHSFQPLIMRVTDGSQAANPVMGVSAAFNTMVVRVPKGSQPRSAGDSFVWGTGMTIVLGSSSTQSLTTEDGVASIVPTPGAARGPCDLFIAVNAGPAVAQFDLQVVAAEEEDSGTSGRSVSRGRPWLQSSADLSALLVAVPEGMSSSPLPLDTHASPCSEPSQENADSVAEPCSRSKPSEVKSRKKPAKRVEHPPQPANDVTPASIPAGVSSNRRVAEDKRSCRVLAEDGTLP